VNKSKMLALLLLVAVAATGFFSGRASSYVDDGKGCEHRERASFSGMLQDSLGLSDAQRDTIRVILQRHRGEMQALMEPVRARMDSVRMRVNDEIAASLPDDKRVRFAELRDKWRAERARTDSAHRAERRSR
jgi:Spy/CpxP family protein refolding chaperone